jgi:hypothetical protein
MLALTGFTVAQFVALSAYVLQRTKMVLLPWTLNAVLTIGLSLALGRLFGLRGVIAALVASDLAFALCWLLTIRRATTYALVKLASNLPSKPAAHNG